MSHLAAKARAVPTSLGSRQWSATTFAAGVRAVAMESKQEPWSDDEDDGALLSKIQELQVALANKKDAKKTDCAAPGTPEAHRARESEDPGETQPASEAELALVRLERQRALSEVSAPTSTSASEREDQLQLELLEAKRMIEKLAAQISNQKPSTVGETTLDDRSGGSGPLPSSGHRDPNPDQPNQPVVPPAGAAEKEKPTKPAEADKNDKVSEAAAQGRLRRICEMKPSQKLNCPEWMHQQWKVPSNRPSMIEHLQKVNWNKDAFIKEMTVLKERSKEKELKTTRGWYSKKEMAEDLNWDEQRINGAVKKCRRNQALVRTNQYDGVDEFWVDVRTTGSATYNEKELEQEKHTRTMESGEGEQMMVGPETPAGLSDMFNDSPEDEMELRSVADQEKELKDFIQSILAKTTKLHQLIGDLQSKYDDARATRAVSDLETACKNMEGEYDKLIKLKTRGELQGFEKISQEQKDLISSSTYVCSDALATQVKVLSAKVAFTKKAGSAPPKEEKTKSKKKDKKNKKEDEEPETRRSKRPRKERE